MHTSRILMVHPRSFCANAETMGSNSFQKAGTGKQTDVALKAGQEFENFQRTLTAHGIEVLEFDEDLQAQTPDALFPNNWFWQMPDGRVFISAMHAPNRRREFRQDILDRVGGVLVHDFRPQIEEGLFLEGTGSVVFDHAHKLAYACVSPRTSAKLVQEFAKVAGYKALLFTARDTSGHEIYHTNVMMAVGSQNVVINLASITDPLEREMVVASISSSGKDIVDISQAQMANFAGNMLLLQNTAREKFWVCSTRAFESLKPEQLKQLQAEGTILHAPLTTIEDYGGGGARCLMAEVWL